MNKLVLSLAFVFTASIASAMCDRGHQQAMSCGEGQTYDAETGACVPQVNS